MGLVRKVAKKMVSLAVIYTGKKLLEKALSKARKPAPGK